MKARAAYHASVDLRVERAAGRAVDAGRLRHLLRNFARALTAVCAPCVRRTANSTVRSMVALRPSSAVAMLRPVYQLALSLTWTRRKRGLARTER